MNPIERAVEIFAAKEIGAANAQRIAELERELGELRMPRSARSKFAKALGVTDGAVRQWEKGDTAVSIRFYADIERLTDNQVTHSDLVAFEQQRLEAKAAARKAS